MREVAVVSFAQSPSVRRERERDEVEMLAGTVREAVEASGLERQEIGFTCSGSCDFIAGQPFSFVLALDAVGAWPPIHESHVEMDGAWALFEAWVKIQTGEVDSALVYAFGRSSMGDPAETVTLQLDPYLFAPLAPDAISLAALQTRMLLDVGATSEKRMAEIAARNRRRALDNPCAQVKGEFDVDALLADPYLVSPLRRHDCPPISDGVAAVVLAADDVARRVCERPAWIRGIDHRIEPHALGARDLTRSVSTGIAGERAGAGADRIDVAELYAPFSSQEDVVADALGLGDTTVRNPSGGVLAAHSLMVAGLIRIGEAAARITAGAADRALAHATSGPCLQQNLVCVMEGA